MPFTTGLSGLKASNADLRITGNNIANASTTGYKQSRGEFADVFAASALGTSGNAIGSGVQLARVAQQFTQGTVTFTDNNLDLAINGEGFFSLDANGERLYARAGAFSVDNTGQIVNASGANLRGFLPDFSTNPEGEISGAVGNLVLDTANIPPVPTTGVDTTLNLDSGATAPASAFSTGFTTTNPPSISSYNNSSSINVFDSLGVSHILTMYFVKDSAVNNQWQLFVGIDGQDVTPAPTTAVPNPYTLTFDSNGQFVVNDPTTPPTITSPATVTSTPGALVNSGALGTIDAGDVSINGTLLLPPAGDGFSTTDATASAAAINNAITAAAITGLSTTIVEATTDLGVYTPPTPAAVPAAGDWVINGVDILAGGTAVNADFATVTALRDYINTTPTVGAAMGITASVTGGTNLVLTNDGTDAGKNIQLVTDGSAPPGMTFANFSLGTAADRVQRGSVTLQQTGAAAITIAGNSPLDAGFTAGTSFATINQTNSDVVTIANWDPGNGASTQSITLSFDNSTQFGANFAVQALTQNGSSTGRLAGLDADESGILFARFTNGRSRKLGQIILANFANNQGLQPQGNSNWSETFSSGAALEGVPQSANLGSIQSGALEDSNVQLTEELVDLIIAQRNFQANAQTIRTADTVTQTIINIR